MSSSEMPATNKAAFVRKIAHRNLGIGCDQLMELVSRKPLAIQVWNQDGSKAEMCANGSRTFLFLAARQGWINRKAKRVQVRISGKNYEAIQTTKGNYELSLGEPQISPLEMLSLRGRSIPFYPVTTGNPHAVVLMTGKNAWKAPPGFDYRAYGAKMETHRRFPKKANVEFVRKIRRQGNAVEMEVEAWERGAGATLSCGSGAVAAAAVVRQQMPGSLNLFKVRMTDFTLRIRFEGAVAFISGPCALVAEGNFFPKG